jgi:hypothetical protein
MSVFVVRDTILYPIPSGHIYYDGFKKLGWKCFYLPIQQFNDIKDVHFLSNVDIFFDYQNVFLNPNHAEELKRFKEKNPNCKIFVSCYLPYDHNLTSELDKRFKDYEGVVDYFFNSTIQHNRAKNAFDQLGLKYLTIPFPSIVDPLPIHNNNEFDVTFIGTIEPHSNRYKDTWYPAIKKNQFKKFFSGFDGYPSVNFQDMLQISYKSKINLNPHYDFQIKETDNVHSRVDFNTRVFNLATLGCFQLTNHPYLKKLFGECCPVFEKDTFLDMFEYYLFNDDARIKITRKMQEISKNNYTSTIFAKKISENNYNFI